MNVTAVKSRLLMGPGPSDVNPRVLQAMAGATLGHLDPHYLAPPWAVLLARAILGVGRT